MIFHRVAASSRRGPTNKDLDRPRKQMHRICRNAWGTSRIHFFRSIIRDGPVTREWYASCDDSPQVRARRRTKGGNTGVLASYAYNTRLWQMRKVSSLPPRLFLFFQQTNQTLSNIIKVNILSLSKVVANNRTVRKDVTEREKKK